ncbi:hypothetical protein ACP275_03G032800 [Erythranthe tilingii]
MPDDESIENFSIAAAVHARSNNQPNKFKDKHCEHCNREGHTIENCRTLKFHCKYCDRKGHTKGRCKFKSGTWVSNNAGNRGSRQRGSQASNIFPATNATDSSQSGIQSQTTSMANSTHGFSVKQLQQLASTLSMMFSN